MGPYFDHLDDPCVCPYDDDEQQALQTPAADDRSAVHDQREPFSRGGASQPVRGGSAYQDAESRRVGGRRNCDPRHRVVVDGVQTFLMKIYL